MQTASPYSENAHGTRTTLENDRVYLTQNGSDSMATVVPIDGSNYLTWATDIEIKLDGISLDHTIVQPELARPNPANLASRFVFDS